MCLVWVLLTTAIGKQVYDQWSNVGYAISYSLPLISRMASVFYGIGFGEAVELMETHMSSILLIRNSDAEYLIRSFVTHMASEIYAINANREIDKFVLLIDEAKRMEELIFSRFEKTDSTSIVRIALLNSDMSYNEKPMKCGLLVSSLSTVAFGDAFSTRPIQSIALPSKSNNADIISKIWNHKDNLKLSNESTYRLNLIAATVNNLPRLVEIVNDFILKEHDIENISGDIANRMYEFLRTKIKLR